MWITFRFSMISFNRSLLNLAIVLWSGAFPPSGRYIKLISLLHAVSIDLDEYMLFISYTRTLKRFFGDTALFFIIQSSDNLQ